MVSPAEPNLTFADLGQTRKELARLESLGVISTGEAEALRTVVAEQEGELEARVKSSDWEGAGPFYRLLRKLTVTRDEVHLPLSLARRLEDYYTRRRPGLLRAFGALSEGVPADPSPLDAPSPETPAAPPREPETEVEPTAFSTGIREETTSLPPATVPSRGEAADRDVAEGWSLARFLEAVNIGWGMLAASLLIVGCSIALVITLWQSDVPLVRYLAFLGVTLGLNGVGQLVRRRLGLAITGNTLLAVSMALMPLNLVAAEVLGGAGGRAVSPAASAVILLGFAAVAWSSFRLVWRTGAFSATLAFAGLIGLQLAVAPLRERGPGPETAVAWIATAIFLVGLQVTFRRRRRDPDAAGPVPLLFTGGLLAFAHLLLWTRVLLDGLGPGRFDLAAPVVVLHLLGGLMIGRELRREAAGHAWAGTLANALDTLFHFAVPLVLLTASPANGLRLLVPAVAAIALYGTVARWYRSWVALAAGTALTGVAYYAALILVHEWVRGAFSWQPVSWAELAFQMLPLVLLFLVAGEALARRRRAGSERATAWASPVLLAAGCYTAAALLATMVLDRERLGEAVALLGGLAFVLGLVTRRRAYAHATLASLPIVLALRPGGLEHVIDPGALVVWLGAVGIAYVGAGLALARTRAPLAKVFGPPFVITALLMVPPIVAASFLPELTDFSVLGPLACLLVCAAAARVHPVSLFPAVAGGFYTLAAGLAIHRWVSPISQPVPASVAWALATALPPLLVGLALRRRRGARARLYGDAAFAWGLALVFVQPLAYLVTPVVTITAICSGASALLLVVAAGIERRQTWSWFAAGFVGLTGFFIYHLIDPVGGRFAWALGTGATVPTWIPLAPLFTAVALLGGAALSARGWRRDVFARPFVVASIAATIATVILTLLDPIPARKAWTLALAVLPLLAIHFRLTRQPVFLLGFVGLLWQAMIGVLAECIPVDPSVDRTVFELFSALLAGTAAVAVAAVGLERALEIHARRPAGAWLKGISLRVLPVSSRVLGLGTVFVIGFVALTRFATHEHASWNGPAWPGLLLTALALLIGGWSASIWARRQIRFLLSIGITSLVALGWLAYLIDSPLGWRWVAFGFALHAVAWLAPGRLFAVPRRFVERLRPARDGRADRAARGRAMLIGQASTGIALIVAAIHPDHPASIATGALLASFWLWQAARARSQGAWLPAAVVLATVTAYAALHRIHPVVRTGEGMGFDPDRLFPYAVLAAVLAAGWYGLGRWNLLRGRAGRTPVFHAGLLRAAGFVLSLVAFGLLGLMLLPALASEPTAVRGDYVGGAVLILVLTAGYLVAATWERRPFLVFLAEACIAGFCLYLRVTHPWIYRTDVFRRFWPLILVGVSYGATILEQLLQRLRVDRIYLGPLRYTGLILPLGPLVGVWFRPEIDTTLITTVGAISGFYAMVAYLHRSMFFAYLSTAVANATMIAWAQKLGWAFTVHPQIFLWPIGLSLLGIAHVQRRTLPAAAVRALRGIGACIIYGSMATAIFTDVAHQNLEMILLAIIAVAGITAGIGLKIRAFLYAGFGFLIFDVGYMVFRAGREDTWVWWMAGIALGVAVLLAFAFFEKRKQEVEHWVRTLRTWD